MRLSRPSLLGIAALASLLATSTLALAWAASHLPGGLHLLSSSGKLILLSIEMSDTDYAARVEHGTADLLAYLRSLKKPAVAWAGVEYQAGDFLYRQNRAQPYRYKLLAVPYGWLILPAAMPAAAWLATRLRRGRRVAGGLCGECGYDLRASPERCPECGAVPNQTPAISN